MVNDERWQQGLTALDAFIAREGHAKVPSRHEEPVDGIGFPLGQWVAYNRRRRQLGRLHPSRVAALDERPGWAWGPLPPGPAPKEERNRALRAERAQGASLDTLAQRFGLSRQRVHQLVRTVR